jgi:hypothetical protein
MAAGCLIRRVDLERTGAPVPGVRARCRECGANAEASGVAPGSIRKALQRLQQACLGRGASLVEARPEADCFAGKVLVGLERLAPQGAP